MFLITFSGYSLYAQKKLWTPVSKNLLAKEKKLLFKDYQLFQLDTAQLLAVLADLSSMHEPTKQAKRLITLPAISEKMQEFAIFYAPIVAEQFSRRYNNFRSYRLYSLKDKAVQGRVTWTPKGLYAHLSGVNGESVFIEKVSVPNRENHYITYSGKDVVTEEHLELICGNKPLQSRVQKPVTAREVKTEAPVEYSADLKIFRLAIIATEGFTNATGGTVASTLSGIVNTLTSLNVIFERDLGIRFLLHERNDELIFSDARPAPFTDKEGAFHLWEENAAILDSIVGSASYDIGHVFAAECSGGVAGLAYLAGICSTKKANGVSCIFNEDVREFRKTLYHEVGHQMGANHTWSNCGESANNDQRHPPTAVEPGSGSTVMSYGGVCGPYNIVADAHDNLHGISILEIKKALGGDSKNCFQEITTGNLPPVISLPADSFFIPVLTPFELIAEAFDENLADLSYSWEQFDTGAVSDIGFPLGTAPSFRSYFPVGTSSRTFPRLTNIILNRKSDTEVLPDSTRQLTFGITVRDNFEEGGSTTFSRLTFFASATAGPFLLTYPNETGMELFTGDSLDVTWDVANTNLPPVNCEKVDIYISFDNGQAFTKLLAEGVENNGLARVILPDTTTNRARIKIKCADNIFFDMSDYRFKLLEGQLTSVKDYNASELLVYPNPAENRITLKATTAIKDPIDLEILNTLGQSLIRQRVWLNKSVELSLADLVPGTYYLRGSFDQKILMKKIIISAP